jgi:hypothetical protein
MSETLTESSTFTASIVVPTGGDTRNAASVKTPFQSLTNRTKYLNDLLTSGVKKVRSVATLAAMKALTSVGSGELCNILVAADDDYIFDNCGTFFFVPTCTDAAMTLGNIPIIVVPDDGIGRWVNILAGAMSNLSGASTSVRWDIPPANATAGISEWTSSSPGPDDAWETVGPGGSEVAVSGVSLSRSVLSGDKILIDGQFNLKVTLDGASDVAYVYLYGGITTASTKLATARVSTREDAAAVSIPISFHRVVTAGSAGSYVLALKCDSGAAGTQIVFMSQGSLRMQVIRP